MNITNFKLKVAAWVNRDAASFVVNGFDILLDAINDAHREAQQKVNFARSFRPGFIQTNMFGVALSGATSDPTGGGAAVTFRVVESAWEYLIQGTSYSKFKQIDMIAERDLKNMLPFSDEYPLYPQSYPLSWPYVNPVGTQTTIKRRVYIQQGTSKIFLTGTDQLTWVWLDGYQLMPDYDAVTVTTDFILDNYHGWLLWASLQKLNGYLKEDQRVVVSQRALDAAWDTVMLDDSNIRESYATQNALN